MGLTTTREFRWDDPGAPILNGEPGSFYNLIKACLVGQGGTAYGTRPAAGWELAWDDAGGFKAAFRNSQAVGGSGCYLRVVDDASTPSAARVAQVAVYEQMTDIDTGIAPAGSGYVWKSSRSGSRPVAWTLHADERTAYITIYTEDDNPKPYTGDFSRSYCYAGMFGDIAPAIASDPGAAFASVLSESHPGGVVATECQLFSSHGHNLSGPGFGFSVSRGVDLSPKISGANILGMSGGGHGGRAAIGGSGNSLVPSGVAPGIGGDVFSPALIVGDGTIRGRARGLFIPLTRRLDGSARVGTVHTPLLVSRPMSFACLAGATGNNNSSYISGRLFVERTLSWDDV